MPVFRLDERLMFPPAELAEESGLLAVGGDLRPERLLTAYAHGIFPWYSEGLPILWHSPNPRMALLTSQLHVPRSLRKVMRRQPFDIRFDTAFEAVIDACSRIPRRDQESTWITREMREAYVDLHLLGHAHSAEAWLDDKLVGGLYGVSIGDAFFGESMFTKVADASKIAFVTLIETMREWGIWLVDCQVYTEHLARFGALEWPREEFLLALADAIRRPSRVGHWQIEQR